MPTRHSSPAFFTLLAMAGAVLAASLALGAHAGAAGDLRSWLACLVLAIFGELLAVELTDGETLTFSVGVLIAACALFGPIPAALIAMASIGLVDLVRGHPLVTHLYNVFTYGTAGVWGAFAFAAAGGTYGVVDGSAIVPLIALITAHVLVMAALQGTAFAVLQRTGILHTIAEHAAFAPMHLMEYSLGVLLAWAWSQGPAFLPFLLPLLFAVYRAHARSAALQVETGDALNRLADIVDERDPYTYAHSERVGRWVDDLAAALSLPDDRRAMLQRAGRLHDLGKIVVDASILRKPGRLTEGEFEQIQSHPAASARLLQPFSFAAEESRLVELHHERFDGKGYYRVPAQEIPLEAHFLILADAWDAMTTDRPYRDALTQAEAADQIEEGLGRQFHPILGRAFVAAMRGLPVAEALEADELAMLRRELGRRTRRFDARGRLAGGVAALVARHVRLLVAVSLALAAAAALVAPLRPALLVVAALAAAAAMWRHASLREGRTRVVETLRETPAESPLIAVVAAIDQCFPVRWAGSLAGDEFGIVRRVGDPVWVGAVETTIEARIDGALRRAGSSLHVGGLLVVEVAGRPLQLLPEPDGGWFAVLLDNQELPDDVRDAAAELIARRARGRLQLVSDPPADAGEAAA